ncbi:Bug family tripartite tricarboxylate transporter substrate binding protein [Schauerella aestuarii]|uniref:Bug family tripartite tricarboxylate transporter substrate binding protein n=1 Tax=Schauerella aestuarii TaxID=2511204 RepID=UPI00136EF02D|nr:tripartite tricarboxylate transporter substrate-binding protein [Achromobacter aestuarii]MYZ42488.1 tripartite tricarboxylate transporter substrate binding protein [Achromobacter aestuarii]
MNTNTGILAPKRRLSALAFAGVMGIAMTASAQAGSYPERPISLVVPYTAGGATDVLARTIGVSLSKELKQPVIVENLPGAGGTIGQSKVARAAADGYTILLGNVGTLAANPSVYKNLPYDILKDFTAIASVGDTPQVLSVRANFPASNLDEFAKYAKANDATMNFGDAGIGSGAFLGGIMLNAALGINVTPVHYRGAAQANSDVMAGLIDYTVESISTAVSSIAGGKIKGLAVLGPKRASVLPDVPSTSESAFKSLDFTIWNMVMVRSGTPPEITSKLNAAINKALTDPDLKERYAQTGVVVPTAEHRSLVGAQALLVDEVAKWHKLLGDAGVKPE